MRCWMRHSITLETSLQLPQPTVWLVFTMYLQAPVRRYSKVMRMRYPRFSSIHREIKLSRRAVTKLAGCGTRIQAWSSKYWTDTRMTSFRVHLITVETQLSRAQRTTHAAFGGTSLLWWNNKRMPWTVPKPRQQQSRHRSRNERATPKIIRSIIYIGDEFELYTKRAIIIRYSLT